MASCGGLTDSRLASASAVALLVVRTKSTFPLPGTEATGNERLSRTPVLAGPEDARTAGSHAGWLFQVKPLSTQLSSDSA
jgi:hypothetical protein